MEKKKAPEGAEDFYKVNDSSETAKKIRWRRRQLIDLLSDGNRHSVADIIKRLPIGDPRSDIRDLRNLGIRVRDEWCKGQFGRYKRYYIEECIAAAISIFD